MVIILDLSNLQRLHEFRKEAIIVSDLGCIDEKDDVTFMWKRNPYLPVKKTDYFIHFINRKLNI